MHKHPLFEDFFNVGQQESYSPYLTKNSKRWSHHLKLKSSLLATLLFFLAFTLAFFPHLHFLSSLLILYVYFIAGTPPLITAIKDLFSLEINIDTLMICAAFSSLFISNGQEGALLLVLFSLSHSLDNAIKNKVKSSLNSLKTVSPTTAIVLTKEGNTTERSIKDIYPNTTILVKPGEIIPLDGIIVEGCSHVNLVHLTGESTPILKQQNDSISSGAQNLESPLTIRVTHSSYDSTLSKTIELIIEAQQTKPHLQCWFDKISKYYSSGIILFSIFLAAILPPLYSIPFFGLKGSIYRAITFLIAASPCALILAIPSVYLAVIGACIKKGIILKGGIVLEALASCKKFAFDKTGTLTTGELVCTKVDSITPSTEEEQNFALTIVYSLEKLAKHPIAFAIANYIKDKEIEDIKITDFKTEPGIGISGKVSFKSKTYTVFFGHPNHILTLFSENLHKKYKHLVESKKGSTLTSSLLKVNDKLYLFHFEDKIRPLVKETIEKLKNKWDIKTILLTGDQEQSASQIAKTLHIDEYKANLKPHEKLECISTLSKQNNLTMIGDGMNDAPALAKATVGISMAKKGSHLANNSSDILLLHDNIEILDWLYAKTKQTQHAIKINLAIASFAILIAVIPAIIGFLPLWLAVCLHEGGTLLVCLNGLRLLKN